MGPLFWGLQSLCLSISPLSLLSLSPPSLSCLSRSSCGVKVWSGEESHRFSSLIPQDTQGFFNRSAKWYSRSTEPMIGEEVPWQRNYPVESVPVGGEMAPTLRSCPRHLRGRLRERFGVALREGSVQNYSGMHSQKVAHGNWLVWSRWCCCTTSKTSVPWVGVSWSTELTSLSQNLGQSWSTKLASCTEFDPPSANWRRTKNMNVVEGQLWIESSKEVSRTRQELIGATLAPRDATTLDEIRRTGPQKMWVQVVGCQPSQRSVRQFSTTQRLHERDLARASGWQGDSASAHFCDLFTPLSFSLAIHSALAEVKSQLQGRVLVRGPRWCVQHLQPGTALHSYTVSYCISIFYIKSWLSKSRYHFLLIIVLCDNFSWKKMLWKKFIRYIISILLFLLLKVWNKKISHILCELGKFIDFIIYQQKFHIYI